MGESGLPLGNWGFEESQRKITSVCRERLEGYVRGKRDKTRRYESRALTL